MKYLSNFFDTFNPLNVLIALLTSAGGVWLYINLTQESPYSLLVVFFVKDFMYLSMKDLLRNK
jgi:hypothetical protein